MSVLALLWFLSASRPTAAVHTQFVVLFFFFSFLTLQPCAVEHVHLGRYLFRVGTANGRNGRPIPGTSTRSERKPAQRNSKRP